MTLKFEKRLIAMERFEAAGIFDVNNNGVLDIVSGAWWYEGPDFVRKHWLGPNPAYGDYYDDFSVVPMDVNGDGRTDFVTGGWFGKTLRWMENPENPRNQWPVHIVDECGNIETVRAWDVDGDGVLEVVPNTPNDPLAVYKLVTDANGRGTGRFVKHTIWNSKSGHGLGCGDINGNGRLDFVLNTGWLEAPADPFDAEWTFHPEFNLGSASVPIIVTDVNGNGVNDLIVGQSHGYGLSWWEQKPTDGGGRSWVEHPIDPFTSQYHDLQWLDIDGDGIGELVTGKRYMAHCGRDPGARDDVGVYWFKWTGEGFAKQVVNYGPFPHGTGCGIQFATADLTGNGLPDLVAPGKDGLYVFYNRTDVEH